MPESNPILDAVATTLIHHPEFTLVEVQGHADERSNDEYNLRLTRDRAHSVVEALVQRGVTRDRMRSQGYGEYCPLDEGHNEAAWEKNRRVEFKLMRVDGVETGVALGCEDAAAHGIKPTKVPSNAPHRAELEKEPDRRFQDAVELIAKLMNDRHIPIPPVTRTLGGNAKPKN